MASSKNGRLVWNHSTHIPGLIPLLQQLATYDGIQTVTPAVIGQAKGRAPQLHLKVSVPIRGGFKLIARQGKSYQEVFVITTLTKEQLEAAIVELLQS